MSARRKADLAWTSQGALTCDGMANATLGNVETTEANLADVFNLWAERIADVRQTITDLECKRCGRTSYWCVCQH